MLSRFSVKRPYTVVVAVLVVLILGVVAFMGMQVDLMPSINLPYSVVVTTYAGASPEEVETVVTEPLEQSMATVSNIKNIMSISSENMSLVILEFNQSTDMSVAGNEMREKIDLVKPYWSDEERISTPMIMQINPDMMPVVIASVDVDGKDAEELSAFLEQSVLPKLESVEGVAAVTAIGTTEHRIDVTIDEALVDDINEVIVASINGDIGKAKAMLANARTEIENGYKQLEAARAEGESELNAAQGQIDVIRFYKICRTNENLEILTQLDLALTSPDVLEPGYVPNWSDVDSVRCNLNGTEYQFATQYDLLTVTLIHKLAVSQSCDGQCGNSHIPFQVSYYLKRLIGDWYATDTYGICNTPQAKAVMAPLLKLDENYVPEVSDIKSCFCNLATNLGTTYYSVKTEEEKASLITIHKLALEKGCDGQCGLEHQHLFIGYTTANGGDFKRNYLICDQEILSLITESFPSTLF